MGRAVNLVVSCSNRKRYPSATGLAVRELTGIDIKTRLRQWKKRLAEVAIEEHAAASMYIGDHWSIARDIPSEAAAHGWKIRLWICSAGYGLIQPHTLVKSYQATFATDSPDSVQVQALPRLSMQQWWTGVCTHDLSDAESSPRSLTQLAQKFPRTPLVVALSADYLAAIEPELRDILSKQSFFRRHLSIISCGTRDRQATWGGNLLPCDSGVSNALGGALTSLNSRVARYLFQREADADATVAGMTKRVASIAIQTRTFPNRAPQSDEDVERFIRRELKKRQPSSKSKLLDRFRASGKACEQKRFGTLYVRLREEAEAEIRS